MGRPLNKKYFGNRNIGSTSRTADNGIGGEGVASVTTAVAGSININDSNKHFPALTGTGPSIPNGVTATYAVTWEVDTITLAGGTGYTAGAISSITGLDSQADTPTRFTITQAGGVPSVNTITERGSYTSIDGTGISTWAIVKGSANDAQATITFRVKSIAVVEKGSGYVSVPSLTWGALNGTTPTGQTPSLTTDSGAVGSETNQENAIIMTAYLTGGSATTVDIIKQVSTHRYKVTDGTRTGIVKLVAKASGSLVAGEANIIAVDNAGTPGTYYVTKLTAHKATLTRGTGTVYTDGAATPWTFGAATATVAKIPNA